MKTTIMILAAMLCLVSIEQALALECLQCNSDSIGDDCWTGSVDYSASCDNPSDDVCFKITTRIELPHRGPEDRTAKHQDKTYRTRGCGNKKGLARFTKVDECSAETLGGGGDQEQCLCTGNNCNSVSGLYYCTGLLIFAFISKILM